MIRTGMTAKECRDMRISIPDEVPDVAVARVWIEGSNMTFIEAPFLSGELKVRWNARVSFEWLNCTFEIGPKKED